jgi:hypothetical protein
MMRTPKFTVLLVLMSGVAGCATYSTTPPSAYSTDEIYDRSYRDGARDAIDVLREGLRSRQVYGVTDPYIPLRAPDEIIPIWVPDSVDKRGRRISGHWQHTVIRRSQWYTE